MLLPRPNNVPLTTLTQCLRGSCGFLEQYPSPNLICRSASEPLFECLLCLHDRNVKFFGRERRHQNIVTASLKHAGPGREIASWRINQNFRPWVQQLNLPPNRPYAGIGKRGRQTCPL